MAKKNYASWTLVDEKSGRQRTSTSDVPRGSERAGYNAPGVKKKKKKTPQENAETFRDLLLPNQIAASRFTPERVEKAHKTIKRTEKQVSHAVKKETAKISEEDGKSAYRKMVSDNQDASPGFTRENAQKAGKPTKKKDLTWGGGGGRDGKIDRAEKPFSPGKLLLGTVVKGSDEAATGLAHTAKLLIGGNITNAGLLLGQDWSNNPVNKLSDKLDKAAKTNKKYFAQNVKQGGKAAKAIDWAGTQVFQAVPAAVLAMMTGGANEAGEAATLGADVASRAPGVVNALKTSAPKLIKDPNYWASFLSTVGNDYKNARADGASDVKAGLYAMANSVVNAMVEVGGDTGNGGIQTLPKELKQGGSALKKWVSSMVDEGKEEVVQGAVERGFQNLMYQKGNKAVSVEDPTAILNPKTAAKEFGGGAMVGGILGGGQILTHAALSGRSSRRANADTGSDTPVLDSVRRGKFGQAGTQSDTPVLDAAQGRTARSDTPILDAVQSRDAKAKNYADLLLGNSENGQLNESSNRGTVDSTEARVQKAVALKENGAAANRIFNETGLILVNNGSLVDGESGSVVGSVNHDSESTVRFYEGSEGIRGAELSENGRGSDAPRSGNLEHGKDRENLGESARPGIVTRASGAADLQSAGVSSRQSAVMLLRNNMDTLQKMRTVVTITGNEIGHEGRVTDNAIKFLEKIGNKVFRPNFGEVLFSRSKLKNSLLGHGFGQAKVELVAALPNVIGMGEKIEEIPNWKGRGYDSFVFAAPVTYRGKRIYVDAIVIRDSANRYYLHEAVDSNGNVILGNEKSSDTASDRLLKNSGDTVADTELSSKNIAQSEGKVNPIRATENNALRKESEQIPEEDHADYLDALARDENLAGGRVTPQDIARNAETSRMLHSEAPPKQKREPVSDADVQKFWKLCEDTANPITDSRERDAEAREYADSLVMESTPRRKKALRENAAETRSYLMRKMVDSGDSVRRVEKLTGDSHLYDYYNMARASASAGVNMIAKE